MTYIIEAIIMIAFGAVIGIGSFLSASIGLGICGCVIFLAGVYQLVTEIIKNKKEDKNDDNVKGPYWRT